MSKGLFIVFDGTDGSGKGTQTALMIERLKKEGYPVETADFPQYGKKSAGAVEEYLNGNYGTAEEVGPYRASIFYATDRYDASFKIRQWLSEGKVVISNRYVSANMAHQGGKIADDTERQKYFDWLAELEYGIFQIPKPDLNLILHCPAEISSKLIDQKADRSYIQDGKKRDIHEADINHLRQAEKVFLQLSNVMPNTKVIKCVPKDVLLSIEEVHELIWIEVSQLLK